jgi:phenylalanyl-tRNA synthetase beta subunit
MAIPNLTSDIRGAIKICNAVIIENVLFIHGHNNLPFKEITENDIHANDTESIKLQEHEAEIIFEQTGFNVVMSNSFFEVYAGKHFISTGCFEKTRGTAIDLNNFAISKLTHGVQ